MGVAPECTTGEGDESELSSVLDKMVNLQQVSSEPSKLSPMLYRVLYVCVCI